MFLNKRSYGDGEPLCDKNLYITNTLKPWSKGGLRTIGAPNLVQMVQLNTLMVMFDDSDLTMMFKRGCLTSP